MGRSAVGRESCSLVKTTMGGEPLTSRRRQYPTVWRSGHAFVGPLRGTGSGTHARAWFGTGETRLCSLVSKDRSYKPVVKSNGAQRESDGVVVPGGVLSLGKGPDFGQASGAGTREGMTGTARPNHPGRREPIDKVRRLQRKLWAAAKQSEGRRFHALYDRIYRDDVLVEAWRRVRANRGAAGVDRVALEAVEAYGVERMLGELARDLRAGVYRPALVRRVEIPKPDGRKRPLGIPTVRDRVCQQAAATRFVEMDRYVAWRLKRLLIKRHGRNLRPGQASLWTRAWFHDQGLHKLMGTIRYPKAA